MKRNYIHIVFLFWMIPFILLPSCIEPYDPEIDRYENVLVVDGLYTNADEDMFVRLSRTIPYYESGALKVTGAVVVIVDDLGYGQTYTEESPGTYKLEKGLKQGLPGMSYKISIETMEGEQYESDYQLMKKPVEIDSVYYELDEDIFSAESQNRKGIRFFLDSKDEEEATQYYRFDWLETWEYGVPHHKPGFEHRKICWRSAYSNSIGLSNTGNLSEDRIYRKELYTVTNETNRLHRQYSSLIRQYSISREAFEFWKNLKEMNELTGTLFDTPPSPIIGNIQNVNDPYEPVLGFFEVSGVSEKRVFVDKKDLPIDFSTPTGYQHCEFLLVQGEGSRELANGWLLLQTYEWLDTLWTEVTSHHDCYDCTGVGSNSEPTYWNEFDE